MTRWLFAAAAGIAVALLALAPQALAWRGPLSAATIQPVQVSPPSVASSFGIVSGTVVDASNNTYTFCGTANADGSPGQICQNNVLDPVTNSVVIITFYGGHFYQENSQGNWYELVAAWNAPSQWLSTGTSPPAGWTGITNITLSNATFTAPGPATVGNFTVAATSPYSGPPTLSISAPCTPTAGSGNGSLSILGSPGTLSAASGAQAGSYPMCALLTLAGALESVVPFAASITGNGTQTASACGPEAAPPQVVAAFGSSTVCVANFDFTAATGASWMPNGSNGSPNISFSGPVSTMSNWYDCPNNNPALPWHAGYFSNGPCNAVITTDTVGGGVQALQIHNSQNIHPDNNRGMEMCIGDCGNRAGTTPITWGNYYVEIKTRNDNFSQGTGGQTSQFNWSTSTSPTTVDTISLDNGEDQPSGDHFSDTSWSQWQVPCPPCSGGFFQCLNANVGGCSGKTALWPSPGTWNNEVYHTYGGLQTSNGSSHVYLDSWVNNTFVGSVDVPSLVAGQFNNRNWLLIQENNYSGNAPLPNFQEWIQYIRVWSCASWVTTQCNGTTLVGGSPPALTYYQSAPPPPPNIIMTADNATNANGAPADVISSITFPFAITTGGGVSEPERVLFWNNGTSALSITNVTYTGPFSTATTNCSGTLAKGAFCYLWINFTPTATGTQTGTAALNFAGGSQAIPLSGAGQSGNVVNVSGCGLPTMAANTTYVMGDVTCTGMTIHTANNSVLQGDCKAPEGANTIFNGNASTARFANGLADNTNPVMVRCVTMEKYGAAGCPDSGGGNPQFDMNTGWTFANVTITLGCGAGTGTHNGSNEIYHSHISYNAYIGGENQNSSGTYSDIGNEYDHNSTDTSQSASSCYPPFDCGANKATNTGAGATFLFKGLYSHDQIYNAGRDPPGVWCDGVGTQPPGPLLPEACGALFEVDNSTIVNNAGDGLRHEISTSQGTFTHNVIKGNGPGGNIVGACSEKMTVNNNYFDNTGGGGDAVAGNFEGRCTTSFNATATFSATGNLVIMRNTGLQFGLASGFFSGFHTTSDGNAFWTAGNGTGIAAFNSGSGNVSFATWKAAVGDTTSTIQTGTPGGVPSGCTGDGVYGIGCIGSGI